VVRAAVEQQLGELLVAALGCRVQRSESALLADVRIRARLEEDPCRLTLSTRARAVQRRDVAERGRHGFEIGSALDQEPRRLGLPEEGREMERRPVVRRASADELGIRVEQLPEATDSPESRGLEEVQLRLEREEPLDLLGVAAVHREHQRRRAGHA